MLRSVLKYASSQMNPRILERMLVYPLLKREFPELKSVPVFSAREELWTLGLDRVDGRNQAITYVEFGVFRGESIRHFARANPNPASLFIGLDSFEGLPEEWGKNCGKGHFDTGGQFPQIDDPRVRFIKGWFQNTWNELHSQIAGRNNLVVHYDADLYSSTLFTLAKIDSLGKPYMAVFDEFTGDETRALYNYKKAFNPSVTFLGTVLYEGYPLKVLCSIVPQAAQQAAGSHRAA